jgi:hypothetical protein
MVRFIEDRNCEQKNLLFLPYPPAAWPGQSKLTYLLAFAILLNWELGEVLKVLIIVWGVPDSDIE